MRLIDADALLPMMKYATTDSEIGIFPIKIGFNAIAKVIDDAPTMDAVPVIRCKECKFSKAYYHGSESNLGMFTYLCTQGLYGMNADDFCSRAERKDDD